MSTLVTLATYRESKTAHFLKETLENENIECFFNVFFDVEKNSDLVRVQVKEENVEKSIQVMMGIREKYGNDIDKLEPVLDLRKIIVPADFSEGSENACYYAVHLAQKIKAEIKVLHVYEKPVDDDCIRKQAGTFEKYVTQALEDVEKRAKARMVALITKIREYMDAHQIQNVRIHSTVAMGNIIRRIESISKIYKPDMIVLGTLGRKEESRSVFVGIANQIVHNLQIPVYAVPGPFAPGDFERLEILYATDFNEKDHTSLDQLLKVLEPFDKTITCVHIDTAQNPSERERMDELNDFLKKEYDQHEIHCRLIEDADVIHGIRESAGQNNIKLLSFTTRKRGIFEKLLKPNLFKKILQEANLPILIFPS